jgi:hypothetical protein
VILRSNDIRNYEHKIDQDVLTPNDNYTYQDPERASTKYLALTAGALGLLAFRKQIGSAVKPIIRSLTPYAEKAGDSLLSRMPMGVKNLQAFFYALGKMGRDPALEPVYKSLNNMPEFKKRVAAHINVFSQYYQFKPSSQNIGNMLRSTAVGSFTGAMVGGGVGLIGDSEGRKTRFLRGARVGAVAGGTLGLFGSLKATIPGKTIWGMGGGTALERDASELMARHYVGASGPAEDVMAGLLRRRGALRRGGRVIPSTYRGATLGDYLKRAGEINPETFAGGTNAETLRAAGVPGSVADLYAFSGEKVRKRLISSVIDPNILMGPNGRFVDVRWIQGLKEAPGRLLEKPRVLGFSFGDLFFTREKRAIRNAPFIKRVAGQDVEMYLDRLAPGVKPESDFYLMGRRLYSSQGGAVRRASTYKFDPFISVHVMGISPRRAQIFSQLRYGKSLREVENTATGSKIQEMFDLYGEVSPFSPTSQALNWFATTKLGRFVGKRAGGRLGAAVAKGEIAQLLSGESKQVQKVFKQMMTRGELFSVFGGTSARKGAYISKGVASHLGIKNFNKVDFKALAKAQAKRGGMFGLFNKAAKKQASAFTSYARNLNKSYYNALQINELAEKSKGGFGGLREVIKKKGKSYFKAGETEAALNFLDVVEGISSQAEAGSGFNPSEALLKFAKKRTGIIGIPSELLVGAEEITGGSMWTAVPQAKAFGEKGFFKQFIAGSGRIEKALGAGPENVTSASFWPAFYTSRLNDLMEPFGLGFTPGKMGGVLTNITKFYGQRILPIIAAVSLASYADYKTRESKLLDYTPLDNGLFHLLGQTAAHANLIRAKLFDLTRMTDFIKHISGMFPGWGPENWGIPIPGSSLSIGTPFKNWGKSYDELKEWYATGEEEIRKGRYWPFGKSPFAGGRTSYYRPNWLRRLKSGTFFGGTPWKQEDYYSHHPLYGSLEGNPFGWLTNRYWFEKQLQAEGRPVLLSGPDVYLQKIPLFGEALGYMVKPQKKMVSDEEYAAAMVKGSTPPVVGEILLPREEAASYFATLKNRNKYIDLGRYSGQQEDMWQAPIFKEEPPLEPRSPLHPKSVIGSIKYGLTEIGGIYGFMFNEATGGNFFNKAPELSNAGLISAPERFLYEAQMGGMFEELPRRFVPHRRREIDIFNPLTNSMPSWMPGGGYFINFRQGDPYSKISEGEYRLPGPTYERMNELHGNEYDKYSAFDKYKILSDVAPWSEEHTIYKNIAKAEVEHDKSLMKEFEQIVAQRQDVTQGKYKFFNKQFEESFELSSQKVGVKRWVSPASFEAAEFPGTRINLAGVSAENRKIKEGATDASLMRADEAMQYLRESVPEGSMVDIITKNGVYGKTTPAVVSTSSGITLNNRLRGEGFEGDWKGLGAYQYNAAERAIGAGAEQFAHMHTPFHSKFLPVRSAKEQWQRYEVYGSMQSGWESPYANFLEPYSWGLASKGPVGGAAAGFAYWSVLGGGNAKAGMAGAAIGGALGAYKSIKEFASGDRWIPGKIQTKFSLDQYFDMLEYIKWENVRKQAIESGNGELYEMAQVRLTSTMQGADPFNTYKARVSWPKQYRDYYEGMLATPKDERQDLIETVPAMMRAGLLAGWNPQLRGAYQQYNALMSKDQKKANFLAKKLGTSGEIIKQIYHSRPDLQRFYKENYVPGPDWVGWQPGVDMRMYKLKTLISEGFDEHEFGYWEQDVRHLESMDFIEPIAWRSSPNANNLMDRKLFVSRRRDNIDVEPMNRSMNTSRKRVFIETKGYRDDTREYAR